jgi:hypothetical protein
MSCSENDYILLLYSIEIIIQFCWYSLSHFPSFIVIYINLFIKKCSNPRKADRSQKKARKRRKNAYCDTAVSSQESPRINRRSRRNNKTREAIDKKDPFVAGKKDNFNSL